MNQCLVSLSLINEDYRYHVISVLLLLLFTVSAIYLAL